jgi:hypothetical protein
MNLGRYLRYASRVNRCADARGLCRWESRDRDLG